MKKLIIEKENNLLAARFNQDILHVNKLNVIQAFMDKPYSFKNRNLIVQYLGINLKPTN